MSESVKTHLAALHQRLAEHHVAKAAQCGTKAKCFEKMAKAAGENSDETMKNCFGKVAEMEQQNCDEHADAAKFHTRAAKALGDDSQKVAVTTTTKTVPAGNLGGLEHFVQPTPEGD